MIKRKILIVVFVLAGFLFITALPRMSVHASPANPNPFVITQPDGTSFQAVLWGDENGNGYETATGFSIDQDKDSKYWYYLTAQLDGTLSPAYNNQGRLIVGRDLPIGLKKHLRPILPAASPGLLSPDVQAPDAPPANGTHKVVVLLAGFPTATGRTDPSDWHNLIFGAGPGSLKHYYETVSYGAFSIAPAAEDDSSIGGVANDGVIGWLDLGAYYSDHPNPGSTVSDVNKYITKRALQVADSYINFASFDTNGSGSLSSDELHIIVVVAGFERSYGELDEPAVWAHNSDLSGTVGSPTLDGKVIANASRGGYYSQVGEFHHDHMSTMGVIAHVFGNDLRWPDLYDTDYTSYGVGAWSVMGTGSWNGLGWPGDSPAFPDAWLKWYQGWLTPTTISGFSIGQSIPQTETNMSSFLLRPNPTAVDWLYMQFSGQGEYFLVENRQLTSYDAALPGCGLLIWHIDETRTSTNSANANEVHPLVKLIEADGLDHLKLKINAGDSGDPYPGSTTNRDFTLYTTPNSKLYNDSDSFVRVTNISDCAATMTADLLYGYPLPTLNAISPSFAPPSTTGIVLNLYGTDFYPNSIVRWNGSDRTTYYVDSTELQAIIPATDMVTLGGPGTSAAVTVFNPQPGGGVSATRFYQSLDMTTLTPQSFIMMLFRNFSPGPALTQLWATNFEGTFPTGSWDIIESGIGDYHWGKRDCRAANGTYSAWAVGGGTDGYALTCGSPYPNNIDTSMTYGPFSTQNGVQSGHVKFNMYLNSEVSFDYLWIIFGGGGTEEWGYRVSGNTGGWVPVTVDLSNVDGLGTSLIDVPRVWLRFRFTSDYLVSTGEGAFIDDIVVEVCKSASCSPSSSPSLGSPVWLKDYLMEPVMIQTTP